MFLLCVCGGGSNVRTGPCNREKTTLGEADMHGGGRGKSAGQHFCACCSRMRRGKSLEGPTFEVFSLLAFAFGWGWGAFPQVNIRAGFVFVLHGEQGSLGGNKGKRPKGPGILTVSHSGV